MEETIFDLQEKFKKRLRLRLENMNFEVLSLKLEINISNKAILEVSIRSDKDNLYFSKEVVADLINIEFNSNVKYNWKALKIFVEDNQIGIQAQDYFFKIGDLNLN